MTEGDVAPADEIGAVHETLKDIRGELRRLKTRERRIVTFVAAAVIGFAVWNSVQANQITAANTGRITADQAAEHRSCLATNTYRAADVTEWQQWVNLAVARHLVTPAEGAAQMTRVRAIDRPRDCSRP